jgi:hypothetical protein
MTVLVMRHPATSLTVTVHPVAGHRSSQTGVEAARLNTRTKLAGTNHRRTPHLRWSSA